MNTNMTARSFSVMEGELSHAGRAHSDAARTAPVQLPYGWAAIPYDAS